jgi:hypothetical protein
MAAVLVLRCNPTLLCTLRCDAPLPLQTSAARCVATLTIPWRYDCAAAVLPVLVCSASACQLTPSCPSGSKQAMNAEVVVTFEATTEVLGL